jgi:hypothetical protein
MAGSTTNGFPYPSGTDKVRDGDDLIKMLAEAIEAKLMPTGWTALTLSAGYVARTGHHVPAYRVFPNGTVELRGGIDKSSGNIISGQIPVVIPTAARPVVTVAVVVGIARTGPTYPATGRLDISPTTGNAVVAAVDAGSSTWLSLDGVRFQK